MYSTPRTSDLQGRLITSTSKYIRLTLAILLFSGLLNCQPTSIPGFSSSPYFEEQIQTLRFKDMMTIHINAPAISELDPDRPIGIALFALPNGNTIEQTAGKVLQEGDDWHYNIQHIAAQTRYLRQDHLGYNLVTVYLEADQLSWPAWKASQPEYAAIVQELVSMIRAQFSEYETFLILTGHSGGGRFVFSFLDGANPIPEYVKRICFLDSDYGYEHHYGDQLREWLDRSSDHYLSVLAYNDSIALYKGKTFVSATGGTWYRSRMMQQDLAEYYPFQTKENDDLIHHRALDGRIMITLKKNPDRGIYHTEQVELNGFIHTMVSGTERESVGYEYFGDRVYEDLIQAEELPRTAE
ncbi:MAG: hypothetical protein K9M49_02825 [Candidatus Marinimicrobia bacterium]|nr:hypothetical protein [Candidatus Neomarinimicrobiota bacterium]MCF7904068.1 hypothetical protein [Candidatus Neomarinimicrobiota bacterium]